MPFVVQDLGLMPYRQAWTLQEQMNARVAEGGRQTLLLVEHPPVITFGRRRSEHHIIAPAAELAKLGIEAIGTDRGGDVTFHGPGQLVAYPIVRLLHHHLSVGAYVRRLEDVVIATLGHFGVAGVKDPGAIGVWVRQGPLLAKICALGVRIQRGVSMHGIALNVETNLQMFELIIPCGLEGRPVTSLRQLLGPQTPAMNLVKETLAREMNRAF